MKANHYTDSMLRVVSQQKHYIFHQPFEILNALDPKDIFFLGLSESLSKTQSLALYLYQILLLFKYKYQTLYYLFHVSDMQETP